MTKDKRHKGWKRDLLEWLATIGCAIGISMLIQTYAYAQTEVHNISMEGTLVQGHRLIEDKLSYRFHTPERGDIVIINGPESELRLIKRLIALPGDTVDIREGSVYLNGTRLAEPYAQGDTQSLGLHTPFIVPEGKVFVLGDNRNHSLDSRELGLVSISSLEGKAIFRLWPLERFGTLD